MGHLGYYVYDSFFVFFQQNWFVLFLSKEYCYFCNEIYFDCIEEPPKATLNPSDTLGKASFFLLTQATLMMVVLGLRSRDGLCSLWSKRAFYSTAGQTSVGASWALAPQTKRAPRRRGMRQLDKRCNCIAKHELLDLTHLATSFLLQIKCFSCIFVSAKNKICSNYGSPKGPLDWIPRY